MQRCFLTHLRLQNYRCFPDIAIDFHPQLTVLVAPNGGGKTAILDGIATALRPFVHAMEGSRTIKGFDTTDIRRIPSPNYRMETIVPVQLKAQGIFFGSDMLWEQERRSRKASGNSKRKPLSLETLAHDLIDQHQAWVQRTTSYMPIYPLIAYYGTSRLWNTNNSSQQEHITPNARNRGYTNGLASQSHYNMFIQWFRRFSYEAKKEPLGETSPHEPQRHLQTVQKAVDIALAPTGWHSLEWDFAEDTIVAHHTLYGRLPVDTLSDGIRTMIGLVADIAYRSALLNPQFYEHAAINTPGIVLIDEVDMHLHPTWQQLVLPSLQQAFPLLQYIGTTHSPQVLTTLKQEHIRVISVSTDGQWIAAMPTMSPLAHEAGDALALIMQTHPRPNIPSLMTDIHAYEQLARAGKSRSIEARQIKERLAQAGFEFNAADQALFDFLARKASGTQSHTA